MSEETNDFEQIEEEIRDIFAKRGYILKSNFNDNGTEWNLYSNGINKIRLTMEEIDIDINTD